MKTNYAKQLWTIPNILGYLRIALIPFIAAAYLNDKLPLAFGALALSAFSDAIDGFIARKFDQVTDLGKVLDPIADKLTEAAVIVCVATRHHSVVLLLFMLAVKELCMTLMGLKTIRLTGGVFSAKWYGKVCTACLYLSMAVIVLFPSIPANVVDCLVVLCAITIVLALVMYARWHMGVWKLCSREKENASPKLSV